MYEFDTMEKCIELFRSIGCLGNENNIFFAYKDTAKTTGPASFLGGAVGAFASGMAEGMNHPYDAVIINQTENGIGMLLLKQQGVVLTYKIEKMFVQKDKFIFIPYQYISEIKVKKAALLNNKRKSITISTTNGMKYYLLADIDLPLLPYHNYGFARFMQRFPEK